MKFLSRNKNVIKYMTEGSEHLLCINASKHREKLVYKKNVYSFKVMYIDGKANR